jgi:UDP-N-acetylmuramate--alanine ligase
MSKALKVGANIHFVGVGGIGMSGLAVLASKRGFTVSGCNNGISESVKNRLESAGIKTFSCHDKEHLNSDIDLVVFSTAIPEQHEERLAAVDLNILSMHRSELLAFLMKDAKNKIAISGSHGKTTVSSMVTWILHHSNKNPTAVVGGIIGKLGTNVLAGSNDIFVVEADESDKSLLNYKPTIALVNNIDAEHLDVYKNLDEVKNTFLKFFKKLPANGSGKAILNIDDGLASSLISSIDSPVLTYGIMDKRNPDFLGKNIKLLADASTFEVWNNSNCLGSIELNVPGVFNVTNALAAMVVSLELGVEFEAIKSAIKCFPGVGRRFEFKGTCNGANVFDDYAHHPTEILNTAIAAKNRTNGKLFIVFQPQRYSRTRDLWKEFVQVFKTIDAYKCFVLDIYSAGEKSVSGISSKELVAAIGANNVIYSESKEDVVQELKDELRFSDLVITMGAGDVFKVAVDLLSS